MAFFFGEQKIKAILILSLLINISSEAAISSCIKKFFRVSQDIQVKKDLIVDPNTERIDMLYKTISKLNQRLKSGRKNSMYLLTRFLKRRELVPEDGVIHVVGPFHNFYEWSLFLFARPDTKLVIFETQMQMMLNSLENAEKLRNIWNFFAEHHPNVIKYSHLNSFYEFVNDVLNRVQISEAYTYDITFPLSDKYFVGDGNIPKADLLFSRYPLRISTISNENPNLKKGGIMWIVSEDIRRQTGVSRMPKHHLSFPENEKISIENFLSYENFYSDTKPEDDRSVIKYNLYGVPALYHDFRSRAHFIIKE